ncbi:MAG: transposase, partial [Planctomycetes bacterium]|nr:transposase [Planctomycetota bacterium]
MPRPIVIAHHLIWTVHGHWLPNDPRGSTSRTVCSDLIAELGEHHYGRRRVQPPRQEVREFYDGAGVVLEHPLLAFSNEQIDIIAEAFAEIISQQQYTCYACAVMPDHTHLVIRKHKHRAEEMIDRLQMASRLRLQDPDLDEEHSIDVNHPVWTSGGFGGFIDHPDVVRKVIRYIENNPLKQRMPGQSWDFVKTYDGWPLHPGHSANSPYAK